MRRRSLQRAILVGVFFTTLGGCRACGDSAEATTDASGQRPIPTGILAPIVVSDAAPSTADKLRVARHQKGGGWTELQVALPNDRPDRRSFDHWREESLFLSLDAMTLLHGSFSRALSGFDLFMPRLFDRDALLQFGTELVAFKKTWIATGTAAEAKQRWAAFSSFVRELDGDAAWLAARGALGSTIDQLVTLCQDLEAKNQALWVLGI